MNRAEKRQRKKLARKAALKQRGHGAGDDLDALLERGSGIIRRAKALELRPDYAEAHNNLGLVLRLMGKLDDAVAA